MMRSNIWGERMGRRSCVCVCTSTAIVLYHPPRNRSRKKVLLASDTRRKESCVVNVPSKAAVATNEWHPH
jgi:Fe-S-cluster-containing hydrogenase component 2